MGRGQAFPRVGGGNGADKAARQYPKGGVGPEIRQLRGAAKTLEAERDAVTGDRLKRLALEE